MDPDFLEPLTTILRATGRFGHRGHLTLAWTYLEDHTVDVSQGLMASAVHHVSELHGAPERYHETLTRAWVVVGASHHRADAGSTFDDVVARHPALLDPHLLHRHYSPALLGRHEARNHWVLPDLRPLPTVV
jgi:hypothetical protein